MEIRNLMTFIRVAELCNFTRAAEALGYTQSTVSFQIKQLEDELGCLLFERINHTLLLTDKGRELSAELIRRSPRGVTMMEGEGMYTSKHHDVIMTCVKNRQLTQLKQIVSEIDKNAFIIINDSIEVRGKGFQSLQGK